MAYFLLRFLLFLPACSGSPRKGAGAPEADDGQEGRGAPEEPDPGAEGAAQADPARDESPGNDVPRVHEDLSHQPQRGPQPERREGQNQTGMFNRKQTMKVIFVSYLVFSILK